MTINIAVEKFNLGSTDCKTFNPNHSSFILTTDKTQKGVSSLMEGLDFSFVGLFL